MNKYRVFYHESSERAEVIRYGFNFWAFFFDVLYFLFKGAWRSALMWFAGFMFLAIMSTLFNLNQYVTYIISFAFKLYCGFDAADCLAGELRLNKTYRDLGFVFADNESEALALALRQKDAA